MTSRLNALLVLAGATFLHPLNTATAAVIPMDVGDLAAAADRIVIGDVTAVESYAEDTGVIKSRVQLAVTDDLVGKGDDAFTLVVLGGTADGVTMYTSVTPAFLEGDHVLLFLRGPDLELVGAYQGAYLTDGDVAVPMQPGPQRYIQQEVRPFEALLATIGQALGSGQLAGGISAYGGPFSLQGVAAYSLSSCNWSYKADPMGEVYRVNANCIDSGCGSPETVGDAVEKGADVWINAGVDFYFNYAGTTTLAVVSFNGQNIIFWDTDGSEGQPPGVIATTYYWCSGGNMTEWDMSFNEPDTQFWDGVTGSCGGFRYDIQSVAAHELGHTLGLGHSSTSAATMYFSTGPCNTGPRTLHSDDINGASAIYGNPSVAIPFTDDFVSTSVDTAKWVGIDGVTSNTEGTGEPSAPYSLDLDGNLDGGNAILSSFMDLSSESGLRLKYWYERTSGADSPEPGDDLVIEYAQSTGFWATLDQQPGDGPDMSAYDVALVDLPAGAYHDDFRVRFRAISPESGADDWFVDDICIGDATDCPDPAAACPWDCDGSNDGEIGVNDFLAVLAQWGQSATSCHFGGGAVVGIDEFLDLLAHWGSCP